MSRGLAAPVTEQSAMRWSAGMATPQWSRGLAAPVTCRDAGSSRREVLASMEPGPRGPGDVRDRLNPTGPPPLALPSLAPKVTCPRASLNGAGASRPR